MSHPKNNTQQSPAQPAQTVEREFMDTPIDNRGLYLLKVSAGVNAEDALHTAKVLSSGIGQICQHMHDSVNYGELVYCDGMAALKFLSETVSSLIWSVEKAVAGEQL
ncbi:hypothetical protein JIQ88_01350 [Pseudomonas sp. PCH44]|uniref:hypothetical protein n=1 Tax=Pseudomonas sp. PCH44 TaxID=2800904 RepID=UPI001BAFCDED|nr:hypothetical protein [Pseudomonas sp. PCH44]MBS3183725.1 hypothetical protein [Pseudomonas sp. PCH44]